jgi:hypothetical protein
MFQARFVKLDRLTNFPGGDLRFVGLSDGPIHEGRGLAALPASTRDDDPTNFPVKVIPSAGDSEWRHLDAQTLALDDGGDHFHSDGIEVRRVNKPAGAVNHQTTALTPSVSPPLPVQP